MLSTQLLTSWLQQSYFGISLWRYLAALLIVIASFFIKKIFEIYIVKSIRKLLKRTPLRYDELVFNSVSTPASAFVLVGGVYLALLVLASGGAAPQLSITFISTVYSVAAALIAIWAAYRLVDILTHYLDEVLAPRSEALDKQFVPLIRQGLRALIVIGGGLTILSSMQIEIGSLLAGLGVGGVAVALAAQDSLGNFFGSIALLADKPFKVGDWIIVDGKVDGFVETIGFRSTQVRSWPNTLVTVPNKLLANEIIDNWSRMHKRRVKQTVGVSYKTTPEQMEELVSRIEEMLRNDPGVHQDFFLVRFTDFSDSSLDIFLYYFTKSIKWAEHLAVRQRVNCNLLRLVREVGTSMAFPSRSIYFENLRESGADLLVGKARAALEQQ